MPSWVKVIGGVIVVLIALWLVFNVILPLVKLALTIILTLAVFGAVIYVVYRALNYDPDKKEVNL